MNKIIQDMIPSSRVKPSLRESIPTEKRAEKHLEKETPQPKLPPRRRQHSSGIVGNRIVRPWHFAVIAFVCLAAIVYGFSIVYGRATVYITPTSIVIPVSGSYAAYSGTSAATGTLMYKIIQTSSQLSQTVPATLGPVQTIAAKGAVVLYNNYTASSQKIIVGTRLSSGNGLIYTTNNSVIIPGISNGTAGSVAVGVTAAAGGSSYNIATSDLETNPSYGDFGIVAYKGGPKYSGFYARLNPNGNGITGGSSGNQIVTSSSSVAAADLTMKQAFQKTLQTQAQALVPTGYVMFPNSFTINYTPTPPAITSSTTATIGMQASFYGIIFKETDLAAAIAPKQYNSSFAPEGLETAQFAITNPQSFSYTNGNPLDFSLSGTLNLAGIISTSTLTSQLAGIPFSQSAAVFKSYVAIATAHATIVPFWKHSFPSSLSRINVIIQ